MSIRFKTVLSSSEFVSDGIALSCPGGDGRKDLLILGEEITEANLNISSDDTIVGGTGDKFVGKVGQVYT